MDTRPIDVAPFSSWFIELVKSYPVSRDKLDWLVGLTAISHRSTRLMFSSNLSVLLLWDMIVDRSHQTTVAASALVLMVIGQKSIT